MVPSPPRQGDIHPRIVRITHWINAIAMIIMIGSGWRIYNDSPLIPGFYFPDSFNLGGDPAVSVQKWQNHASGALQWHFAGMWLLAINGLVYLSYGFLSGRFRAKLWPITIAGIRETIADTLKFKLSHDFRVYNHVQRLLYVGVLCLGVLVVLSGLAIWKPVQFQELAALFGSFQGARWVHFLCMAGIVGFMIVHVALAVLVPQTLVSMIRGRPLAPHAPTDATRS
ncbi:MAG: cytochrome b/b6 domain-containing protein [Hyphomicrobiaceae bacterium]